MNFLRHVGEVEEPRVLRRVLPGNLVLLAEHAEHVNSIALGVWLQSGSRHEAPGQAGIAHLMEHMVFKGTRRHSALEIAKRMEAMGGQIDAFTTKEMTCFHARVFSGQRREAVALLGEILSASTFRREELEKERQVVEEEINSYDDNPEEYAFDLATEQVWAGHPLGYPILGRRETLRRIGSHALRQFHRTHYTRPNLLVAVAGKFDWDALQHEVDAALPLPDRKPPRPRRPLPPFRARAHHLTKETAQTSICLMRRGASYRDHRRHAESVLNTILGVGMSSRLFQRIRENEGLAYSVYSFLEPLADTGLFGVYLGVDPAEVPRAIRLVERELARMREHGVRKWELESAKAQILTGIVLSQESMFDRMSRLASNEMYYGKQVLERDVIAAVVRVTADDVREAAVRLLDPRRFCVVTIGPRGSVRPDRGGIHLGGS